MLVPRRLPKTAVLFVSIEVLGSPGLRMDRNAGAIIRSKRHWIVGLWIWRIATSPAVVTTNKTVALVASYTSLGFVLLNGSTFQPRIADDGSKQQRALNRAAHINIAQLL